VQAGSCILAALGPGDLVAGHLELKAEGGHTAEVTVFPLFQKDEILHVTTAPKSLRSFVSRPTQRSTSFCAKLLICARI